MLYLIILLSFTLLFAACDGTKGSDGEQGPAGQEGPEGEEGAEGAAGSARCWAWIAADGSILKSGGELTLTITKPETGLYCIQVTPDILGNFYPIIATIQGSDHTGALINVNTGWGSACNPYGGDSVSTMDISGVAEDHAFSLLIP